MGIHVMENQIWRDNYLKLPTEVGDPEDNYLLILRRE